jgi:hypothetical protein
MNTFDTKPLLHPGHESPGRFISPGSNANETVVREVMKAPLGKLKQVAVALIGKLSGLRSHGESAPIQRSDGDGESDRHKLFRPKQVFSGYERKRIEGMISRCILAEPKQTFCCMVPMGYTGCLAAELAVDKKLDIILAAAERTRFDYSFPGVRAGFVLDLPGCSRIDIPSSENQLRESATTT